MALPAMDRTRAMPQTIRPTANPGQLAPGRSAGSGPVGSGPVGSGPVGSGAAVGSVPAPRAPWGDQFPSPPPPGYYPPPPNAFPPPTGYPSPPGYAPGTYPTSGYPSPHPAAAGGYPAPVSGYPAAASGYPAAPGGYPAAPGGYPPAGSAGGLPQQPYGQVAPPGYPPPAYPPYGQPGPYDPNAPGYHYFPHQKPPRRKRTFLIVSAAVVVVLLLCGGTIFAFMKLTGNAGSPAAAGSGRSTSDAGTPKGVDLTTLNGVLYMQGQALLRGDEKGWLAPIDPNAHSALTAYKRIYHNMHAMHVAVWNQNSLTGNYVTADKTSYEIDTTYCLVVKVCKDTEAQWHVSAALVNGKAMIEGYTAPQPSRYTSEPYPWEVSTLSAVTGPRVVLAASKVWAGRLATALPIAERAAAAADRYAHWGKPAVYVVYLASTSEGKTWFDGGLRNADGVSYPVQPRDIEITILMPDAEEIQYAGPGGLNTVIQHEMGHVATLQGDSNDHGHDSFIEGIAEYCAYTGHTSWNLYRLEDVRAYIRSGKWSHSIYMTSEITAKSVLTGSAAYGIGYLGLRYLAQTYGLTKMLDFWGDYERSNMSLNASAEKAFGKSWKSLDASASAYVAHAVGE